MKTKHDSQKCNGQLKACYVYYSIRHKFYMTRRHVVFILTYSHPSHSKEKRVRVPRISSKEGGGSIIKERHDTTNTIQESECLCLVGLVVDRLTVSRQRNILRQWGRIYLNQETF